LRALVELIIALVEFLEAEARALRAGTFRLGLSVVLLGVAGLLVVSGVGLMLRGLFLYVAIWLGEAPATLLVGLVTLCVAGGFIWSARRLSR